MEPLRKIRNFLTYTLPTILQRLVAHALFLSPTSSNCSFGTVLVVAIVRAIFNDPTPISMLDQQEESVQDPGLPGSFWVVPDEFAVSAENTVVKRLQEAIIATGNASKVDFERLKCLPVRGEWIGHQQGTDETPTLDPTLSAKARFQRLMAEVNRNITVLFLHGGQF